MLEVKNLKIYFNSKDGYIRAVDDISFQLEKGKVLAIIGESGSGKTVTLSAICGVLQGEPGLIKGDIVFNKQNLTRSISKISKIDKSSRSLKISIEQYKYQKLLKNIREKLRNKISFIFQDPRRSLDPQFTIGEQLLEVINIKGGLKKKATAKGKQIAIDWLNLVNISNPEKVLDLYPNELSGGMLQRVMIAICMIVEPDLLIADEPTTALDSRTATLVMEQIEKYHQRSTSSIILVTHDIDLAERIADDIIIMNSGKIVEQGSNTAIFNNSLNHPYTKTLLKARLDPLTTNKQTKVYSIEDKPPEEMFIEKGCKFRLRCDIADESCSNYVTNQILNEKHTIYCNHINFDQKV